MQLGYYDRTARGRLIVTGRDRKDLLHRLATMSVIDLQPGQGMACCFCTNKGRMIDWTVVLDRGEDLLLLTANPERLAGHIQQYTITEDVTVRNYMAIEIVVCGPRAREILGVDLERWCFTEVALAGVKVQVARIEPLAGDAYSVLAPDAVALRALLAEAGDNLSGADVDRLRIRHRLPAHPNEINEEHNPWEAGLEGSISIQKGCYVGQEVVARLNTYDKVKRRLVALRLDGPRAPGEVLLRGGDTVGQLTTVVEALALGYVASGHAAPGTRFDGAEVVETPF
ncbi:MAG: CAF17-like 4Fe-4S cluster assembly/insertion protein YgfZ [Planctomycetota bacterium]|jgi:folate-binding protein YgfZ